MTAAADDTLQMLLSAAATIWPAPARVHPSAPSGRQRSAARQRSAPFAIAPVGTGPNAPSGKDRFTEVERSGGATGAAGSAASAAGNRPLTDLLVVPHLQNPKLVVPADAPRVIAEALARDSDDAGVRKRVIRAAASTALRMPGVAGLLEHPRLFGSNDGRSNRLTVTAPADATVPSLQRHLSELLRTDVLLCFGVGSARANRKPVVQVFDARGRTVAWAKLGIDEIGRELVRGEAEALRTFWSIDTPPERLAVPRVLSSGPWEGAELLVLTPVQAERRTSGRPAGQQRERRGTPPRAAMNELAGRFGIRTHPLVETEFWRRLGKVSELADHVALAETQYGHRTVALGAWHGDWTPWNMRTVGGQVLLWDFERFACGVPVGMDLAHFRLQTALRAGGERAAERLLIDGPLVDEPGGELLTALYLLELAHRWVRASAPEAGAPLRDRTAWLLRVLQQWFAPGTSVR